MYALNHYPNNVNTKKKYLTLFFTYLGVSGQVAGIRQHPLHGGEAGHGVQGDRDHHVGQADAQPDGDGERVQEGGHRRSNNFWGDVEDRYTWK